MLTAIRAGRSVYFCALADIIDSLARADREGRLRERIRYPNAVVARRRQMQTRWWWARRRSPPTPRSCCR